MGWNRVAGFEDLKKIHQHRINPAQKEVTLMNPKIVCHYAERLRKDFPLFNFWMAMRFARLALGLILAEHCGYGKIERALRKFGLAKVSKGAIEQQLGRTLRDPKWTARQFSIMWIQRVYNSMPRNVRRNFTLVVDATKVSRNHCAMVVALAVGNRAIPLIWRVYDENDAEAYPEEGQALMIAEMLALVKSALPKKCKVWVMVDRGIGNSPMLCKKVKALAWHFLFRITNNVKIDTKDGRLLPVERIEPGKQFGAYGNIFVTKGQVTGYIRAIWDEGCKGPLIVATSDPEATGEEYAQRAWIEQTFRDMKSYGWNMEDCRVIKAEHMSKFLCILVMALGMIMALGSLAIKKGKARKLYKKPNGEYRSHNSLFRIGLDYFAELCSERKLMPRMKFHEDERWTTVPVVP